MVVVGKLQSQQHQRRQQQWFGKKGLVAWGNRQICGSEGINRVTGKEYGLVGRQLLKETNTKGACRWP